MTDMTYIPDLKESFRIFIAQIPNTTRREQNAASILSWIRRGVALDADLIAFPECALTGFSAALEPCAYSDLSPHLEEIQRVLDAHSTSVLLPSALRTAEETLLNAGWFLTPHAAPILFSKRGLTPSERGFFTAGPETHPRTFVCKGVRVGVVVCREVADAPTHYLQPDEVDVVLWPGYWAWHGREHWGTPESGELSFGAFTCATTWKAPLIQASFCTNALEDQRPSGPRGESAVLCPEGAWFAQGLQGPSPSGLLVTLSQQHETWGLHRAEKLEKQCTPTLQ